MKTWNHRRRIKTEDKGRVVAFQGSLLQLRCRDVAFQGSLLQLRCRDVAFQGSLLHLRCCDVTFRKAKKLAHTQLSSIQSQTV